MMRYGYSVAAAALAVFLGREFERNLRIGLQFYDQSWYEFFSRPITAAIMTVVFALLVYGIVQQIRMRRRIKANLAAATAPRCRSETPHPRQLVERASAGCPAIDRRRLRRDDRRRGLDEGGAVEIASLPITLHAGLPQRRQGNRRPRATAKPRCASVAQRRRRRESASRVRAGQLSIRARFPSTSVTP